MVFCSKCGSENKDTNNTCEKCGEFLLKDEFFEAKKESLRFFESRRLTLLGNKRFYRRSFNVK